MGRNKINRAVYLCTPLAAGKTPVHNNWILVWSKHRTNIIGLWSLADNEMLSVVLVVHKHWTFVNYNPLTPIIPVVNGPVYFIKNSSVFLHKSWESSAEELLVWFMGHHADFKASLLLGHRNDHVGPHSPILPSEVSWHSSQRSLTACIISSLLIGDSETSQVLPALLSPPSPASQGVSYAMRAWDCSSTIIITKLDLGYQIRPDGNTLHML